MSPPQLSQVNLSEHPADAALTAKAVDGEGTESREGVIVPVNKRRYTGVNGLGRSRSRGDGRLPFPRSRIRPNAEVGCKIARIRMNAATKRGSQLLILGGVEAPFLVPIRRQQS
jgi:hypothetical protein